MNHSVALITAKLTLGVTMALGIAVSPHAVGHAYAADYDAYAFEVGDDNADGVITEDESGWCPETMGNGVRGAAVFGLVFEGCAV